MGGVVRTGGDLILLFLGRNEWKNREKNGQSSYSLQETEMFTHLNKGKVRIAHVLCLENLKSFSVYFSTLIFRHI